MQGHPEVIQSLRQGFPRGSPPSSSTWCTPSWRRTGASRPWPAITEMRHAERHMERTLFLEGFPEVSRIGEIRIGKNVEEILFKDYEGEVQAVKGYNETMNLAQRLGDNGTREMIAEILKDEEAHVDWLETQRELLSRMGLPAYLQYLAGEFSE